MSTATTTRRSAAKTAEQRRDEAAALHAQLTAQVEELTTSAGWSRFLKFAGAFHSYSLNNLLLILTQYPEATRVAGFRKWQTLGRQVRRGEKGIKIFGYSTARLTVEDDAGEETEKVVSRFPILTVFDIAQTDPIEGFEQPDASVQLLTGEDPAGITATIAGWLTGRGWTFEHRPIPGAANGYTDPTTRAVVVDANLSPAAAAKTALHEAAHVVLHAATDPTLTEYRSHRGRGETEAESVAFVLGSLLDLDTSAYSVGYIAGWADGDLQMVRETASNVLATVSTIAAAFPALN